MCEVLFLGSKLANLAEIRIGDNIFNVELNEGTKSEKFDVHIQNNNLKLYFKDKDFAIFSACVIAAKKRFDRLKGINDE